MSPKFAPSASHLQKMTDACVRIREYAGNTSKEEFLSQREAYDAICMQLSQLGEQVNHLEDASDRILRHFPDEVDWAALKAIRNRISHNYTSVDAEMIWSFATQEIKNTEEALRRILQKRFGL